MNINNVIKFTRDPTAKKVAETARIQRLQKIRKTLSGKYSEQTLSNLESIDETMVNKVRKNDIYYEIVDG